MRVDLDKIDGKYVVIVEGEIVARFDSTMDALEYAVELMKEADDRQT